MPRCRSLLLVAFALASCTPRETPRPIAPHVRTATDDTIACDDVASYTMHASLSASHRTIDGSAEITWRNRSRVAVDGLWWHLYMNAFADAHTLFMRTGGRTGHRGNAPGEAGSIELIALALDDGSDLLAGSSADPTVPDDRTQRYTPLPRAVPPGGMLVLHARFRTHLPHAFARTGFDRDFVFAGQWFPKLAVLEPDGRWAHFPFHFHTEFYADFGRYDVTLDVPRGDVVGATGDPVAPATTHGERSQIRFVATHVHDFAWTSWPHFVEQHARAGDVAIRVLHPPGDESVAQRALAAVEGALPILARRYGPYVHPSLTIVIPPRGAAGVGGMEYPTLFTTEGAWFMPASIRATEYVTIHELAHQWFQGMIATDEWSWPFLDEGLTEYATGVTMRELYGSDREIADVAGVEIGFQAMEGAGSGWISRPLPVSTHAADFPGFASYGLHAYQRTATVLYTAAGTWGERPVDAALARYAARGRFAHPGPEALVEAFGLELGDAFVTGYLRPALFGDASLDDAVVAVDASGATLRHIGAIRVPREVTWTDTSGVTSTLRWNALDARLGARGVTHPIESVAIDPGLRAPLDRDRLDDARSAVAARRTPHAIGSALAWWVGALLRAVGP